MKMHTKKYIDNLFKKAIYEISFIKLTAEDIQNDKLSLIKNKHNKLKEDCNKLKENDDTYKDFKTSKDVTMTKADKTYNNNNSSINDEPAKKKRKVDTNRIDGLKLVLSREGETKKFKSQFKPPLTLIKEIAFTSTGEEPMEINCKESTKSELNSSAKIVKSKIWFKDTKKIMDADKYIRWQKILNFDQNPNHLTNGKKKVAVVKHSISGPKVNGAKHSLKLNKFDRGLFIKIEKLYIKYFRKSVQDTIVTIANILNIISMSNKYHKARINESFRIKNKAQHLKERCDAVQLHGRHKIILETKLKNNFKGVVSSFEESEFDSTFQMVFVSILTVLQVLDYPIIKKRNVLKHLVLLLFNILKDSEYNHPQMFSLLRAKTFVPNCIGLSSLIEGSRDIVPGVTDRMSLFFVSAEDNRKYFQAVIDAVTSDSKEDLALLIDNATFQCSINSMFKDPVDSSIVTETSHSPNNSDEIIQHWFPAKNPDGTYQHIPVPNGNTSQTIGNTAVKQSNVMSQPLNNFYQSFSSPLQKKMYISSTSKVIPTNKCFVSTPIYSHSPLVQASKSETVTSIPTPTTCVALQPSFSKIATSTPTPTTFVALQPSMQNKTPVANSPLCRAEGIILGNKQYKLVKKPTGQMKTVVNNNNPKLEPTILNNILINQEPTVFIKCHTKNCNNSATLLCRKCNAVKYCSNNCQVIDKYELYDWIVNIEQ